jgi:hypothetical protein
MKIPTYSLLNTILLVGVIINSVLVYSVVVDNRSIIQGMMLQDIAMTERFDTHIEESIHLTLVEKDNRYALKGDLDRYVKTLDEAIKDNQLKIQQHMIAPTTTLYSAQSIGALKGPPED